MSAITHEGWPSMFLVLITSFHSFRLPSLYLILHGMSFPIPQPGCIYNLPTSTSSASNELSTTCGDVGATFRVPFWGAVIVRMNFAAPVVDVRAIAKFDRIIGPVTGNCKGDA